MYTIIMDDDKNLVASVFATIYQGENLADSIQFLFPQTYEDVEIGSCIALLKYTTPGNVFHVKELDMDEELYKNKIRFLLPLDSEFTKCAGDISMRITLLSTSTGDTVLETNSITVTVEEVSNRSSLTDDGSMEIIDKKILELQSMVDSVSAEKADNLVVENNRLSLTSNGEKIGDEIDIVTPRLNDGDYDGEYDGILDLNNMILNGDSEENSGDDSGDDSDDTGSSNECDCTNGVGFIEL